MDPGLKVLGDINSAAHTTNSDPDSEDNNDEGKDNLDEWEDDDTGEDGVSDDELSDNDSALLAFDKMYGDNAMEMDYEN